MRSTSFQARIIGLANVVVVVTAIIGLLLISGEPAPPPSALPQRATPAPTAPTTAATEATPPPGIVATPELAREVKANELGKIPVIMYHRIVKKRQASIDRTPAQFRKELDKLARQGYVPISAREFAAGDIRVPAGKFPVVLTFDDGHPSHFGLDVHGNVKPDTAVAIILETAARYPDFRPVATFWINHTPFGLRTEQEQAAAVRWLAGNGFEVANHTWGHPNLRAVPTRTVRKQLAKLERLLVRLGAGPAKTMALPYGSMPRKKKAARSGAWEGTRYAFDGVFLAGAEPSLSPYAKKFDRGAIQRIQSNGKKGECRKWCSQHWLEWLDKHPRERYVSDGDPGRISVPARLRGNIGAKRSLLINSY
ncbi:polysaccharide deacetylase family protein [Nonomuraea ferruginea]|uniref:Polysaccharide deacetylase family protein n=1 Tax=Nonomuraea ferruginea TaxID=46174 RepID=A0ABT4TB82_9ACTN|nr:polysaccharide deacetylase family protein [Nonomuraea ferruginea]MDA0646226.1 polysaccharide deacetylase family protein [Nonomuraea ferruginea]